jgi:hypothetical protein
MRRTPGRSQSADSFGACGKSMIRQLWRASASPHESAIVLAENVMGPESRSQTKRQSVFILHNQGETALMPAQGRIDRPRRVACQHSKGFLIQDVRHVPEPELAMKLDCKSGTVSAA